MGANLGRRGVLYTHPIPPVAMSPENAHKLMDSVWRFYTSRYTLVHDFCLYPVGCKRLNSPYELGASQPNVGIEQDLVKWRGRPANWKVAQEEINEGLVVLWKS